MDMKNLYLQADQALRGADKRIVRICIQFGNFTLLSEKRKKETSSFLNGWWIVSCDSLVESSPFYEKYRVLKSKFKFSDVPTVNYT